MDWEDPWPHFTAAHRLMLGWIKPQWVKTYDFLSLGTLVDEEVVLTPAEEGAPFPNAFIAIEIRVGDGHNYYFEYRRGETGDIGDELLTPDSRIVGIDVAATSSYQARHAAPRQAHRRRRRRPRCRAEVPRDRRDHTDFPGRLPARGGVDAAGHGPGPGSLRGGRQARPHHQALATRRRTPLAEPGHRGVQRRRANSTRQFANVPWNGHPNTVIGRIANHGTPSAPGVAAKFYWKDYTVGGAPEALIGSDTHDIAPGATIDFSVKWTPVAPANPAPAALLHHRAHRPVLRTDQPPIPELTPLNNEAQSNYARFISASASPPSRAGQRGLGRPTRTSNRPGSSSAPGSRTRTTAPTSSTWRSPCSRVRSGR